MYLEELPIALSYVREGYGEVGADVTPYALSRRKGFASKSLVPPPTEHSTNLDPTTSFE